MQYKNSHPNHTFDLVRRYGSLITSFYPLGSRSQFTWLLFVLWKLKNVSILRNSYIYMYIYSYKAGTRRSDLEPPIFGIPMYIFSPFISFLPNCALYLKGDEWWATSLIVDVAIGLFLLKRHVRFLPKKRAKVAAINKIWMLLHQWPRKSPVCPFFSFFEWGNNCIKEKT